MINEIKEEGRAKVTALITKCDTGRTPKNVPYLSMVLEDKSGSLDTKWWNLTEQQAKEWKAGMVVEASGDVIFHKNAVQFRIRHMNLAADQDMSLFVREAPASKEEMKAEVEALVRSMENEKLQAVVRDVLDQAGPDYYLFPAATRNHHNFVGGLAWHTLCMARGADALLPLYPFLDRDLLLAGILLHDLGKVKELSGPMLAEYTPAGNLVGHITMAVNWIDRAMVRLGLEEDEDLVLLKHMVLSHHGRLEFASPVVPMIPEAEMLNFLDNLDARMYMMHNSLQAVQPGTFGPRVFALDNRMLYRRNERKEEK